MREVSSGTTRLVLLVICMVLFSQSAAAFEVSGGYLEPRTDGSKRWAFLFLNQHVGYDHIYGNFSYGLTFVDPPAYVEFWISEFTVTDNVEDRVWDVIGNATSEPFECNISTLDYSVGPHWIEAQISAGPGTGRVGGGNIYFFEHQDNSGEQVLYTAASLSVITAIMVGIISIGFACYRLFSWRTSGLRTSRFENNAVVL
jgi:hypothetical protein